MKRKIAIIGGARPNFMKVAPLCHAFDTQGIPYMLINTGQHFSKEMAEDFFVEFGIHPDYTFTPSRKSSVSQIAEIMQSLETLFDQEKPSVVLVVGDVNSTLAGALVANKMGIPLAHIEAGLRSHNWQMPEETNRVLTDHISQYLFVTCEDGKINLQNEGIAGNVYSVGNLMIDTLKMFQNTNSPQNGKYYYCTLHRAENVDFEERLTAILDALEKISIDATIYLPLHPRTAERAKTFGLMPRFEKIFSLLPPLSYTDSIAYQKFAALVLTDSGGIQEESTYLGVPCLTIRKETERPITVEQGTNTIAGVTTEEIYSAYKAKDFSSKACSIDQWDGKASERIVQIVKKIIDTL